MGNIDEFLKTIYRNLFRSQSDLRTEAKFCEEEVVEIARIYAESIGYVCNDNFIQQPPQLVYQRKRFVWDVFFLSTADKLPTAGGGHLRILIDDETGEVIKKFVGTR